MRAAASAPAPLTVRSTQFGKKDLDDDDADVFAGLDHRGSARLADEDPMGEIGPNLSRQNTGALLRADTGASRGGYGGGPQPAFYGYGANGHDGFGAPQQYLGAYGDLQRQATTASATSRYGPEPVYFDDQHGPVQSRSGTPTNSNPQMVYNDARDSYGSGSGPETLRRDPATLVTPQDRARRTLSVRNGGLDDHGAHRASVASHLSDAYGGM